MGRPILFPHHLSFNCKISYGQVSLKYVFKLYQLFPLINYVLKKIKIWGEKTDWVGKELTGEKTDRHTGMGADQPLGSIFFFRITYLQSIYPFPANFSFQMTF